MNNSFWQNVEQAATTRGLDLQELATAAGTQAGDRVTLDQAAAIKAQLNSAGDYLSLEELANGLELEEEI